MLRLLEIHWIDAAFSLEEDHVIADDWLNKGGSQATTVGYLYDQNEKCVIIYNENFEDGTKRGFTIIPRGMITKVRKLYEQTMENPK